MNEIDLTKVDFEKPFMAGLMDGMPGGFFVYRGDETKKIIYANQKLLDIFDCDTWDEFVELTGGTFIGMVYARDRMIVHDDEDDAFLGRREFLQDFLTST